MALIKCPECGREKVSDTAEACPDCGYGIKAHFDAIKRQRQKQEIYEMKLQSVSMPDKPKRMNAWFGLAIFAGVVTIGSLLSSESLLVVVLMFLFFCWMCYGGINQYYSEMEQYNLAKTNFERYQQEVVKKQEREERIEASKPKCPVCGSTYIEKITTADRTISIAMVGAASGKIGKQYKCRHCKHMW